MASPFGFSGNYRLEALAQRANRMGILHEEYDWDPLGDRLIVRTSQDVEPILERNIQLQNDPAFDGYSPTREWRYVASIPLVLVQHWERTEGLDLFNREHWQHIKRRKLNDPEYRKLRTGLGMV